jgi:uracil-DNA glycosylase family 4
VDTATRAAVLATHEAEVAGCTACALSGSRTQVVVGAGNPDAELMLVGEAPGFHEDRLGLPFAGRETDLVDSLLSGIGLVRDDVYCTTVLKCRPPAGRDPLDEEIVACEPHLYRQLELVRPRVVASLGNFPTRLLTGRPHGVTAVNGVPQEHVLAGATVIVLPLYHPAAALYAPERLARLEADFATIPALLGHEAPRAEPVPEPREPVGIGTTVQLGLF